MMETLGYAGVAALGFVGGMALLAVVVAIVRRIARR